jgi:cell wall-associated NlpC family hydrolase
MESELGARVAPHPLPAPRPDWNALASALSQFLGAPYRLGGTLPNGVDCSGLLQRVYRASQRILLPRHSTDQLDMTSRHRESDPASDVRATGDLIFTWTDREGPCHVGALVVGEDPVVFHASLSRRSVVRDPLARFVEGARRVERVPRASIEDMAQSCAGETGLTLGTA